MEKGVARGMLGLFRGGTGMIQAISGGQSASRALQVVGLRIVYYSSWERRTRRWRTIYDHCRWVGLCLAYGLIPRTMS